MKVFVALFVIWIFGNANSQNLTIMAWNVQVFGVTKMSNQAIVSVLVPTFRKYDISLIQEIRDSSGTAIQSLLTQINNCSYTISPCPQFGLVLSDRLGPTTSKEQYGFFYRLDNPKFSINITNIYQYPDPNYIYFQRPPFNVRFSVNNFNFTLSAIHTQPTNAVFEIDKLVDVYDNISQTQLMNYETKVIILGDFNAGCSYVSSSQWSSIRLRNQTRFTWFFNDNTVTNVVLSCPYDRMVATSGILQKFVNGSAMVDRYDITFGLNQSTALTVSDHFPITITLNVPLSLSNNGCIHIFNVLLLIFMFISFY